MWNDLSLSQKADLFKIYAANGYTSLDNIKEHYNSFAGGGEESLIQKGKKLFNSFKSKDMSGVLDTAKDVFEKLPKKVKERTIETALRANHAGNGAQSTLNIYFNSLKHNPKALKNDINYILFGKGTPSINDNSGLYYYKRGSSIPSTKISTKIDNDIIDAVTKGVTLNPQIATQIIGESGYGIEDSYINKNYPNRKIQYVQTNPPDINYNQDNIIHTGIQGSAGEFVTSLPTARIDNAGIVLEYGNRNDSTFVRGWDVYDFASPKGDKSGYTQRWMHNQGTENDIKDKELVDLLDKYTYPLVIRTPWVYEKDIDKIIKAQGGYLDNLTTKSFSYTPIPQVRYDEGGPTDDIAFNRFYNSLPENQRDSTNFNVRRYWELNGKPRNFTLAKMKGMYTKEDDGLYHAYSVTYNNDTGEYEVMKSMTHPSRLWENAAYNSDTEFNKEYADLGDRYVRRPKNYVELDNGNPVPEVIEETPTYIDNNDKIFKDRYTHALNIISDTVEDEVQAKRLAEFLASQSIAETGWVLSHKSNNYGGHKVNGQVVQYDTPEDFWEYHIKNLDSRWPTWRNAQSMEDYLSTINHTELKLDTKDKFANYNRTHKENPVYIYAPTWENSDYEDYVKNVYNTSSKYFF